MRHPERGVRLWVIGCLCWCLGMASAFGGTYAKGRMDGKGYVVIRNGCSMTIGRIVFTDERTYGSTTILDLGGMLAALACEEIVDTEIIENEFWMGSHTKTAVDISGPARNVWILGGLAVDYNSVGSTNE